MKRWYSVLAAILLSAGALVLPATNLVGKTDTAVAASVEGTAPEMWWPKPGVTMGGEQPFKALMPGLDLASYRMSWQVDGGQLNAMGDSWQDYPHKQASVDLANWTWRGNGPYQLRFSAHSTSGALLGASSFSIYVGGNAAPTQTTITPAPTPTQTSVPAPRAAPAPTATPTPTPTKAATSAPGGLYVNPSTPASRQADAWRGNRPTDAALMDKLARTPTAEWFGGWNSDIAAAVDNYVGRAAAAKKLPVLIAYNIPQRDCGGHSGGGTTDYRAWIRSFASGLKGRPALVVLEPDALALDTCLSAADRTTRHQLLAEAVTVLKGAGAKVYLDAGHSDWIAATDMATRLRAAGISKADGFALNVSNFRTTGSNLTYGNAVSAQVGGKHYVIDTSRNGLGANGEWCNPSGRAAGNRPTTTTGQPLADAYLWLKTPGESDGACNGGPAAGQWWPDYALGLAQRAGW